MSEIDFDVGIIGGGPAGSAMAAYLAKAGLRCAVFERDLFPRPHVGESLVPSSTRVFKELGLLEQMEEHEIPPQVRRRLDREWQPAVLSSRLAGSRVGRFCGHPF